MRADGLKGPQIHLIYSWFHHAAVLALTSVIRGLPRPGRTMPAPTQYRPLKKSATVDQFNARLFKLNRNPEDRRGFDRLVAQVVDPPPAWTIDQNDGGQYYLKFVWGEPGAPGLSHSSDGLGEGLVSLFFVLDSLYDAGEGSMVVIDEPELSLHPQFQRRLQSLMSTLSAKRQIVYATHSPYFVSWADIERGAVIARVFKTTDGSHVATAGPETLAAVTKLRHDANNPHVLGLDASEVFFLEDRVILVEGQEDVIYWRKIFEQLDVPLPGSFFGWGVGGAEKMSKVCFLLRELGYRSVVGLLDNDKEAVLADLRRDFPAYDFHCIPADDIRFKAERCIAGKAGLVDAQGKLRPEHEATVRALLADTTTYLSRNSGSEEIV